MRRGPGGTVAKAAERPCLRLHAYPPRNRPLCGEHARHPGLFALILCTLTFGSACLPTAAAWEIDATGVVYHVVDGDTIDVDTIGRVRLADVNAPEVGQPGYEAAKDFVNATVGDREVFLDVDDVYGTDVYGRSVCVVYVRHNATSLMNVNEALLEAHLAILDDFDNEFDPSTWTLYVTESNTSASPGGNPQAAGVGILDSPWFWSAVIGLAILGVMGTYMRTWRRRRP